MAEAPKNGERPYPKGIYEVPGIEPVPEVLSEYGLLVSQRIHDIRDQTGRIPPIVAPLNGSVVPLYAVCRAWQANGGSVEDIAAQVQLVSTRKVGAHAECVRLTEGDPGAFALIVEDIIDDGGTGEIIEQQFPNTQFELYAPLSKTGKLAIAQARLPRTQVETIRTVDNLWIVGGGGMEGGALKLNGRYDYQNVELAVAARIMDRYVYHDDSQPLPSYEEQLQAFQASKIPWIAMSSPIHTWMIQAEWNKMSGKFDVLQESALHFPYILQAALES